MLYYLDNVSNTSAGPNENYARELLNCTRWAPRTILASHRPWDRMAATSIRHQTGRTASRSNNATRSIYGATQCFFRLARIQKETGDFVFEDAVHASTPRSCLGRTSQRSGQQDGERCWILANHPGTHATSAASSAAA